MVKPETKMRIATEITITMMSTAFCIGVGLHSARCMRQGTVKATGVAVRVPVRELNLSSDFPKRTQTKTPKAVMIVLCKLMNQVLAVDGVGL